MAQLKEGSVIKKSTGDEIIATETQLNNHNTDVAAHNDIRQQINSLDANKVDNSRVLTDVPANAKFTDTITTINGKTGAITKADIVALGIPAQDTVYTHPSTHPASMITESTSRRFVTDTEKAAWNDADSKKHTHSNKSILDTISQALVDAWDSAVEHISDAVKHITAAERTAWNSKCDGDDPRLSDARTPTVHDNTKHSTAYATETALQSHLAESAIHKTSDVIRTETNTQLKVEVVSSSVSETPDAGRIIFDTSQGKFFGGNGTEWV